MESDLGRHTSRRRVPRGSTGVGEPDRIHTGVDRGCAPDWWHRAGRCPRALALAGREVRSPPGPSRAGRPAGRVAHGGPVGRDASAPQVGGPVGEREPVHGSSLRSESPGRPYYEGDLTTRGSGGGPRRGAERRTQGYRHPVHPVFHCTSVRGQRVHGCPWRGEVRKTLGVTEATRDVSWGCPFDDKDGRRFQGFDGPTRQPGSEVVCDLRRGVGHRTKADEVRNRRRPVGDDGHSSGDP